MTQMKYTRDHEWVKLEGNDVAVIGITDYAQWSPVSGAITSRRNWRTAHYRA